MPDVEQKNRNLQAADPGSLKWDPGQVSQSLEALLRHVESEAANAIGWYWKNKKWKAQLSRWIRLWTLLLTASAGILPIAFYILKDLGWFLWLSEPGSKESGLLASALVGLAAALLGVDRAFGFSSGWARYVLAATDIRRRLEEFRMDWIALSAVAAAQPTAEQVSCLIQKAKEFRLSVEAVVTQETKDWVTEFQTNMAQLEKDVRAQLDKLRAQVDQSREVQEAADQPGSIEATVENADKAKNFSFNVSLDGSAGPLVKNEPIEGTRTWVYLSAKPGHYRLIVAGITPDDKPASIATAIIVKSSEVTRLTIRLPIS